MVCSPTLISHIEAGRRLPSPEDAQRLDLVLKTDGVFARWLKDLDSRYADHFAAVAELERQATEICLFALSLVPVLLQTEAYARALFCAYSPNHRLEEVDRHVVNRMERARILDEAPGPVMWTMLDEAVIRRPVAGLFAMADQLYKIVQLAEGGRIRLHVLPFGAGTQRHHRV